MSYILEALKKSEQQREIGRVPGISSVHETTAKPAGSRWRWLIVAVLLLNAGLLGLLLWPGAETEPVIEVATEVEPVEVRPNRSAAAPIRRQPPPDGSATGHTQNAGRMPQPEAMTTKSLPEPVVQKPAMTASAQSPDMQPPRPPVKEDPPAPPPRPLVKEDPPAPPPRPPAEADPVVLPELAPPAPPPVKAATPALPVWPQIPSHLFQQLNGNLRLDVHVFSDQPRERFVLINMKKYKQGEKLQEGPQLDEITAEGVILSFRGQQFRLQAQ